jgi:hypothetical protein
MPPLPGVVPFPVPGAGRPPGALTQMTLPQYRDEDAGDQILEQRLSRPVFQFTMSCHEEVVLKRLAMTTQVSLAWTVYVTGH